MLEPEILEILKTVPDAALGTLEEGRPFVSAVGVLYDPPPEDIAGYGVVYFLLSDLAKHTKNLTKESEASLLVINRAPGVPVHEMQRMTLMGRVERINDPQCFENLKLRYLDRFPRAAVFFQLPDFRFYQMKIREIHWIGGFGKARSFS